MNLFFFFADDACVLPSSSSIFLSYDFALGEFNLFWKAHDIARFEIYPSQCMGRMNPSFIYQVEII